MHDCNGKPLKEGDRVKLVGIIKRCFASEFCNVDIETEHIMPGNGLKSIIGAINTAQLEKIED